VGFGAKGWRPNSTLGVCRQSATQLERSAVTGRCTSARHSDCEVGTFHYAVLSALYPDISPLLLALVERGWLFILEM
jgi:hypothetical protein